MPLQSYNYVAHILNRQEVIITTDGFHIEKGGKYAILDSKPAIVTHPLTGKPLLKTHRYKAILIAEIIEEDYAIMVAQDTGSNESINSIKKLNSLSRRSHLNIDPKDADDLFNRFSPSPIKIKDKVIRL